MALTGKFHNWRPVSRYRHVMLEICSSRQKHLQHTHQNQKQFHEDEHRTSGLWMLNWSKHFYALANGYRLRDEPLNFLWAEHTIIQLFVKKIFKLKWAYTGGSNNNSADVSSNQLIKFKVKDSNAILNELYQQNLFLVWRIGEPPFCVSWKSFLMPRQHCITHLHSQGIWEKMEAWERDGWTKKNNSKQI